MCLCTCLCVCVCVCVYVCVCVRAGWCARANAYALMHVGLWPPQCIHINHMRAQPTCKLLTTRPCRPTTHQAQVVRNCICVHLLRADAAARALHGRCACVHEYAAGIAGAAATAAGVCTVVLVYTPLPVPHALVMRDHLRQGAGTGTQAGPGP